MFGRTKTGKGAPGGPGAAAGSGGGGSGGTAAEPRQQQQQQQQGAAAQQATAATLGSGNLRSAVALPEGEDVNEWLAVAAVDFFHQVNMLYGTLADYCTDQSCPSMTAGPKYKYLWTDGKTKPTDMSAKQYVSRLMEWIASQLEDEKVFPSKMDNPFPKNFQMIVKSVFRRLFRVFAHVYHHHVEHVQALDVTVQLNTSFQHFMFFVLEFNLIEKKELAPLSELISRIKPKKGK